jgi:hypothetical protein
MEITIGKCGLACGYCRHFNRGCMGCEEENGFKRRCLIFECAEDKNTKYCIQCQEFPCNLMRGLSRAYCPVFTTIKIFQ